MRYHVIKNPEQLRALEPQWRELEARGAAPNIFVTFDWLRSYWSVFGRGKRLWLLVGEENGRLRSAAPLMLSHTPGRSLRRLELLGAGIHDYADFVFPPDDSSAVTALWSQILERHREWDSLRLKQLYEDSPTLRHTLPIENGMRVEQGAGETCPSLRLPASWEDYLQMIGKNMRYDLKRYARKLAGDFRGIQFRLVKTHGELDEAVQALIRLHGLRWRRRGLPGVLATSKRRRFQQELARTLLDHDRLRMFVLELDDAPAAVLLNYFYHGRYSFYIGGFDPDRERYRPGTILFGHAIRHAIEEGATEFDFLRGREEYKYRLGAEDRHYRDLIITKHTLRSRATAAYARMGDRLVERVRQFAERRYRK